MNGTNYLHADSVTANSVNIFKTNLTNSSEGRVIHKQNNCWTLDKPNASLSTCHLDILPWAAILLNLVKLVVMKLLLLKCSSNLHRSGTSSSRATLVT